ncbi:DUF421 domain-containing protein [Evansella cellulosilytica]|uniref:YetF C-terminal domain-containing protein n=1 Tax=Evansella cellulosilytica (strain ATCC 21833 / DSM 2522 / FERM P-1141 / JCM 9156 / N-4) TaxID=649639 RepID=E6TSP0_EVAC2|nr:DUF421 domain-containing protein [Evansella cellulosilytica]ADU29548.1 protein of unknown function DUF421 [Evansella cellulosilytica DSM 2522]
MTFLDIFIRTTVAFLVLYILCRLLNKKLIAQMTFFDFVAGITIGSITASAMLQPNTPLSISMVGLVLFCIYTFITSVIAIKSLRGRKILEDEPTFLIDKGKVLENGLKKSRMTMDSLLTNLRKRGVFYVDQVETAILETDGTLSVLKKPQYLDAMKKDINQFQSSRGVPQAFIIDGKLLQSTLEILGKDREWVMNILKKNSVKKVEDVFFAQIDQQGNVYIDKREDGNVSSFD